MLRLRPVFKLPCLLLLFAVFFLSLLIHSLLVGGVTWDEYLDFEGVNGAFWHGINLIKGRNPDFHTITYDLEYYGNATRWPTYLFWRLISVFNWESISAITRIQYFLSSGYVGLNHLNAAFFGALGIFLTGLISGLLPGRNTSYVSALFLLLLPSWLGHGWMNSKDIPFAVAYLLYTYGSTLIFSRVYSANSSIRLTHWIRALGIGLMIGSRATSIVFVICSELIYMCILKRSYVKRASLSLVYGFLAAFALTPQSWSNPTSYVLEVLNFAGNHLPASGSPLLTAQYIALNLFQSVPLVLWLGLACFAFFLFRICSSYRSMSLYAPSLIQLLLAPTLLIIGSKSLYNELRHLLFVYPILCIIAAKGFDSLFKAAVNPKIRQIALLFSLISFCVLVIEDVSLSPYQYTYKSDIYRLTLAGESPLKRDYWGFSVRELLDACAQDHACQRQVSSGPLALRKMDWNQDLFDATSLMIHSQEFSSQNSAGVHNPELQIGSFDSCRSLVEVKRMLVFPHIQEKTISRIADCSAY